MGGAGVVPTAGDRVGELVTDRVGGREGEGVIEQDCRYREQ